MQENKPEEKHIKKAIIAAPLLIGSTMMFQGFTQVDASSKYNQTKTIPTSYSNRVIPSDNSTPPEDYKKASYTVGSIDLSYFKSNTPSAKDLTKETAAELTAQSLWKVYGANMEGQTINMGYHKATDNTPRPTWTADIRMERQSSHDGYLVNGYEVVIDSITGELLSINMDRTLKECVKAGPNASVDEKKFETAARKLSEKYHVVHSDIALITCTGQGASFSSNEIGDYGDPDISFEIHGKNGEVALITISRYDEVLKGIEYDGQYKYDKARFKKAESESNAKAKADSFSNDTMASSAMLVQGN